ncbi:MAG TPA: Imm1 family immunity protein [Pseudonocardiaceae bacterium]
MALEIWYDQEPDNDLGPGDSPVIVRTAAELDIFLDRLLRDTAEHLVPPVIQAAIAGHPECGVMEVGIGQSQGFVNYLAADGGITQGDPSRIGAATYDYMGSATEVDASVEIPVGLVRQGLREYLEREGAKPVSLPWRPGE